MNSNIFLKISILIFLFLISSCKNKSNNNIDVRNINTKNNSVENVFNSIRDNDKQYYNQKIIYGFMGWIDYRALYPKGMYSKLSEKVLVDIKKYEDDGIYVVREENINIDLANIILRRKEKCLIFLNLQKLSKDVSEIIGLWYGYSIYFNKLNVLTLSQADMLGISISHYIGFDSLKKFDQRFFNYFIVSKNTAISLNGLEKLNNGIAIVIQNKINECNTLYLNGIEKINVKIAKRLARIKKRNISLYLNGLKSIDKNTMSSLAKQKSKNSKLYLGLTTLDEEIATELVTEVSHTPLWL